MFTYRPHHEKSNKMTCALGEDSDQPRHLPNMMRVCTLWVAKVQMLLRVDSKDWSDWADLSLHWAHWSFSWFCRALAHFWIIPLEIFRLSRITFYGKYPHTEGLAHINLSRLMTKSTKWLRPAKTQINLCIRPVWSESLVCTQWVAKDPSFLHADSEDTDQTGQMPRLIWVFAGRTCHFVGFVMRQLICFFYPKQNRTPMCLEH